MDRETFAKTIKQKYPQYESMDNEQLVDKIITKYPVYKSQIKDSFIDRVKQDFSERKENVQAILDPSDTSRSDISKLTGASAEVAGAISNTMYEALPETARNLLDKVGGGIGKGFNFVTDKISDSKLLQDAVTGDPEKVKKLEEALQIVSDLGMVAGEVTGIAETAGLTKAVGQVATKGAKAVSTGASDLLQSTKKGIEKVGKKTGISEAIPTPERMVNFQTSRALDLTQGDVKNIAKSTGNEVGEWIAEKNLIGDNKNMTSKAVTEYGDNAYTKVREEIGKVKTLYQKTDIPRYEDALNEVLDTVKGKRGLEESAREVEKMLSKKEISLSDIQEAKELIDENFKLYKVTGDKAESASKEGVRKIREELKSFIEKEVQDNTGADIRALNNDVATSRSITQAIKARSTRGLTRSSVGLGDLGTFGVGSTFGGPLFGVAAVAGKKILESSAVRLRFSKWLDALSDAKKLKVAKQLEKGIVPKEMAKVINLKIPVPIGIVASDVIDSN